MIFSLPLVTFNHEFEGIAIPSKIMFNLTADLPAITMIQKGSKIVRIIYTEKGTIVL
jgi:hypothetical protein